MSFTPYDTWLFKEGTNYSLYTILGSHLDKEKGCHFALWAPNAKSVSVIGDFNNWDISKNELLLKNRDVGIWEGFISKVQKGDKYKYHVVSYDGKYCIDKGDPFATLWEQPPGNASIVWDLHYEWHDEHWKNKRMQLNSLQAPISIYEMHHPSWRRVPEEDDRPLTYRELSLVLPSYLVEMGFTHVEFLPVMEHPFYGSWGYQTSGYFAPSSRYGSPQEFMCLIDSLHQNDIGVILDWVPSHFPMDVHGLAYYDGSHLYEHADARRRMQRDWNTFLFNYDTPQVQSFLISNALFWFEKYHIDGLRIDAVSSMLYLDFSKKPGDWVANIYGGHENLSALHFLQKLNREVYQRYPYAQMIAEESTSWAGISHTVDTGGLGFGMKWNMGWMHDTLKYMSLDPIYRKYHHNNILFSMEYAFLENFILPLSHDEVVYGKKSLLNKMPGDMWQKCANLRLLLGYMYAHPGKKLLFMGTEFGQCSEWNHDTSLDWHLASTPFHKELFFFIKDLNSLYKHHKALYERDCTPHGFEWIDTHDVEKSVISFMRKSDHEHILVICNFTPVPRYNYTVGVPMQGLWNEIFNSDSIFYGGSNLGNNGSIITNTQPSHGRPFSLNLTLPPLAIILCSFEKRL